jgi:hypothetical protein
LALRSLIRVCTIPYLIAYSSTHVSYSHGSDELREEPSVSLSTPPRRTAPPTYSHANKNDASHAMEPLLEHGLEPPLEPPGYMSSSTEHTSMRLLGASPHKMSCARPCTMAAACDANLHALFNFLFNPYAREHMVPSFDATKHQDASFSGVPPPSPRDVKRLLPSTCTGCATTVSYCRGLLNCRWRIGVHLPSRARWQKSMDNTSCVKENGEADAMACPFGHRHASMMTCVLARFLGGHDPEARRGSQFTTTATCCLSGKEGARHDGDRCKRRSMWRMEENGQVANWRLSFA